MQTQTHAHVNAHVTFLCSDTCMFRGIPTLRHVHTGIHMHVKIHTSKHTYIQHTHRCGHTRTRVHRCACRRTQVHADSWSHSAALASPRRHPAALPGLLPPCRQPLPAGESSGLPLQSTWCPGPHPQMPTDREAPSHLVRPLGPSPWCPQHKPFRVACLMPPSPWAPCISRAALYDRADVSRLKQEPRGVPWWRGPVPPGWSNFLGRCGI